MHMDELKTQKIWFCWNYETRKGKKTKVPVSAYGTSTGTITLGSQAPSLTFWSVGNTSAARSISRPTASPTSAKSS